MKKLVSEQYQMTQHFIYNETIKPKDFYSQILFYLKKVYFEQFILIFE